MSEIWLWGFALTFVFLIVKFIHNGDWKADSYVVYLLGFSIAATLCFMTWPIILFLHVVEEKEVKK